jgi:hypothetical protein
MTAVTTQFGGRKELIQGDELPPVPHSLVLKLPEDFTKRRVADVFSKAVILQHSGDIQSFDIDGLVLADCHSRELVNVVGANVPNLGVLFGDLNSLFVAIIRAFDLARKTTLLQSKSLSRFVQRARILKILPVARSRQSFDADIDPDIGLCLRQWFNLGFDQDADEIALYFIFAGRCANQLRIIRQGTRPADLKRLILFCKRDPSVSLRECVRLIAYRLLVLSAFEARIVRSLFEEVFERRIKILEGLLQDYAADILEKGLLRGLLQLCQSNGGSVIVHRLLFLLVGLRA